MIITREQFDEPQIQFIADNHTYYWGRERLRSVTQLVDTLVPPFRKAHTAARIAAARGTTPKAILDSWEVAKEVSKAVGTAVHNFAEWMLLNLHTSLTQPEIWPGPPGGCSIDVSGYTKGVHKFLFDQPALRRNLLPEIRIAHPDLKLAGTVDGVGCDGGTCYILDWKTSKAFEYISSRHMKAPVADLFDCNFNSYALQLSLYAHILRERYDVDAQRLILVRLPGDGTYELHHVVELVQHVAAILPKLS